MGWIVDQITWWHEERHGCYRNDCDVVIEISEDAFARELVACMGRNEYAVSDVRQAALEQ